MDDHQKEINRAKQLYAGYSYGRLRVVADTETMPVANKAAALELMHESEQTIARRAEKRANIAIVISVLAMLAPAIVRFLPVRPSTVILSAPKTAPLPVVIEAASSNAVVPPSITGASSPTPITLTPPTTGSPP